MQIRTREQVRLDFDRQGISLALWARSHGYTEYQVSDVLRGKAQGRRGISHNVAVELGLKEGSVNPALNVKRQSK